MLRGSVAFLLGCEGQPRRDTARLLARVRIFTLRDARKRFMNHRDSAAAIEAEQQKHVTATHHRGSIVVERMSIRNTGRSCSQGCRWDGCGGLRKSDSSRGMHTYGHEPLSADVIGQDCVGWAVVANGITLQISHQLSQARQPDFLLLVRNHYLITNIHHYYY